MSNQIIHDSQFTAEDADIIYAPKIMSSAGKARIGIYGPKEMIRHERREMRFVRLFQSDYGFRVVDQVRSLIEYQLACDVIDGIA